MLKISPDHFKHINNKISKKIKNKINDFELKYLELTNKEKENLIIDIIQYLTQDTVIKSGNHRQKDWEIGWKYNLLKFKRNNKLESLVPKYFDKYNIHRIESNFVKSYTKNFEYKLVSLIQFVIFEKYLKNQKNIYEFGSGTGHNLIRLREINKNAKLFSFEWTQAGIDAMQLYKKKFKDKKIFTERFDNFNPNYNIKLAKNSSIFTFASLEQLGSNYKNLVNYWMLNKPKMIINIEPMSEFLSSKKLPEYLSILYFKKRNYLQNYLNYLKKLEKNNKIKILKKIKTGFGSKFIEGYSIVIWHPK